MLSDPIRTHAANGVWTGVTNNAWATGTNWTGGIPNAAGEIADFSQKVLSAGQTVNLAAANKTVGTIIVGDANTTPAFNYVFTGTGGQIILAGTGGAGGTINVVNRTATISTAILAGTAGFTKTGPGTLVLSNAANTFSGGITLNAGVLSFTAGALNNNLVTTGGNATLTWNTHTTDYSNNIRLGDGFTLTLGLSTNSAETTTFASPLQTGALGTGALTKANASTLIISAAQSYTGGTTLGNGRTILSGGDNRLAAGGPLIMGSGSNLTVVQLGDAAAKSDQTVSRLTVGGGTTANYSIVGGNAAVSTLTINNTAASVAPVLGGSGANDNNLALVKSGSGPLSLAQANTFSGNVTIQGGVVTATNGIALGTGAKTITISGTTNAPSLRLNDTGAGFGLGSNLSFITGNDSATTPAIENFAGNNVISGAIALASGGFGTGGTRIRSTAGSLTLNGTISPQTNAAGGVTLSLDGASSANASGVIADNGARALSVTKEGAGTWSLTAANSYTGTTQITAGRLNVSTSQTGGGAITVGDSAALGVTLQAPGQSLTTSTLTLGTTGNSTVFLNLGAGGNPTAPVIAATSLTTATAGVSSLNIAATGLSVGQFPLISYTGSIGGGGFAGLTLGTLPARVTASLVNGANSVNLNVSSFDLPKWTGETSSVWDFDPDGTGAIGTQNWREVSSTNLTRYLQGTGGTDSVLFDDTAGVPSNVTLSGTLTPASITVNTNTNAFAFSGAGKLSGTTTLTKQGSTTLTLVNTGGNDFTGTTTITGGAIQIGDGATLGAGQLGSGGVINNSALIFNRPDDFAFPNALSGSGTVTKLGAGLLTVSGNNIGFSGNITIDAGTLKAATANALGSAAGGTTVNAGATLEFSGAALASEPLTLNGGAVSAVSGTSSLGGALSLSAGGTVNVTAGTATVSGPISGFGGLVKTGGGTLVLPGSSSFGGGLTIAAGNATLSGVHSFNDGLTVNTLGGTVTLSANQAYTGGTTITQGTLQIGTAANSTNGNVSPGVISFNPDAGQTATLNILRGDTALDVSNAIGSSGAGTHAVNIGAGTATSLSGIVTFSGHNTFTGNVTIVGGALKITNSDALGAGPKTINIQNASRPALILDGAGSDISLAADLSYNLSSDGTVLTTFAQNPGGIINAAGHNTINGNIAMTNGGGGNSKIVVNAGTLTLTGTIDANGATGPKSLLLGGAATGTVSGVISDWFDPANSTNRVVSVAKDGAGTWVLAGANTFTGSVVVQAGTLKVNTFDLLGNAQPLGTASTALTLGTTTTVGTLEYTGGTAATARPIAVTAGGPGGVLKNTGGGELTLSGAITRGNGTTLTLAGEAFDVTGTISGGNAAASVVVSGASVKLSAANTYLGATRVQEGGTLRNGITNALPGATTLTLGSATGNSAGTYDLGGFDQTLTGLASEGAGANTVTNNAPSGTNILTITGTSSFGGAITDGPTAQTALTKSGTGTFLLTAESTYTGPTIVAAGTLAISGGITGTSNVNVTGGTLLLAADNVLADTASITLGGGTFATGGQSEGSQLAPGLGALILQASSTLDFGSGASVLYFSGLGGYTAGTLNIANWTDGSDRLLFAGGEAERVAFESALPQAAISFDTFGGGYAAIQFDAAHFEIVPIPEPASTSLIGAGLLLGLAGYRIRRRLAPRR